MGPSVEPRRKTTETQQKDQPGPASMRQPKRYSPRSNFTMAPPLSPNLLGYHAGKLHDAAISDKVIKARGYQSVSRPTAGDDRSRQLLKRCGFPTSLTSDDVRLNGLLIPLFRATGERISWQYRPDAPAKDTKTGKPRKYIAHAGLPRVLDDHPSTRDRIIDPSVD